MTGPVSADQQTERETFSQLYGWLGDRTSDVDGDVWEHERLQHFVRDLLALPVLAALRPGQAEEAGDVSQLGREHFGRWVEVPSRQAAGYLYVVRDEFHDGYPSRYLVLVDEDGRAVEEEFTDSNPAGYPKTMRTPCSVRDNRPRVIKGPQDRRCPDCESPFHGRPCPRASLDRDATTGGTP